MKAFLAAVRFLTIMPLPGSCGTEQEDLAASVWFFPVVGALLGGVAAGVAMLLTQVLPPLVAAALLVIILAAFSGGLHLDGLSDSADGLLSARSHERAVEIMRDSRVGAMGVLAIVCVVLLKFAALASVPSQYLWRVALIAPLAGRCALVFSMALVPYARAEGGLGSAFYQRRPKAAALFALAVLLTVAWLSGGALRLNAGHTALLLAAGAAVVITILFGLWCWRRLGGATGDTLGAACELAETAAVLAPCGWYFYQRGAL